MAVCGQPHHVPWSVAGAPARLWTRRNDSGTVASGLEALRVDARPITRAATAGLAYFAVVFVAGVALGVTRVLFIVPTFDATVAVLIELPIILALSWIACRRLIVRLEVSATTYARLAMAGSRSRYSWLRSSPSPRSYSGAHLPIISNTIKNCALLGFAAQTALALSRRKAAPPP